MGADQRLVSYIQEQVRAGYDINTIKTHLINYGHRAEEVNAAVDAIYHHKAPIVPIAITGVVVIAAIGFMFFFFLREDVPDKLLDLDTLITSREVIPGGNLDFNVEMINMGSAKRYDVVLKHEILDSSNAVIISEQESAGMETRASKASRIAIPETISPGVYTLRTTASYDGETAVASFMFTIKSKEITGDEIEVEDEEEEGECPVSCEDYNACTNDYCSAATGYVCKHDTIVPCCGDGVCSAGEGYTTCGADCPAPVTRKITTIEIIETIKDKSTDPEQAIAYCNTLTKKNHDLCFNKLSETLNNSIYCDRIISSSTRDSCYIIFLQQGEADVCSKIADKYMRLICEQYAETS